MQDHGIGKSLSKTEDGDFSVKSKFYIDDVLEKYESTIGSCDDP